MLKIYIASFNRASDGAISKLKQKMINKGLHTDDYTEADYILAVGDRKETFDFVLERFREGKKIIHLWAGESNTHTHDDMYRHSITLMSCVQLCTNSESKNVVKRLCKSVGKPYFIFTIGNIMLDNMDVDESLVPNEEYDLILYNPSTLNEQDIEKEIAKIMEITKGRKKIWIEPNGDVGSSFIYKYVTHRNLPRPQFLGLLKKCGRFITNSSCQYYEAPFLMDKNNIIQIGTRNLDRNSKFSNMSIPNASDNVMKIFEYLNEKKI